MDGEKAIESLKRFDLFDSHFHIIDSRFPLVANQGFIPEPYDCQQYVEQLSDYKLVGGAVVSGSFQAFDQQYLINALNELGAAFVGVTQLPASATDEEILALNDAGVKAIRFNLRRGGSESIDQLQSMADRVYDLVGWHVELYIDSSELDSIFSILLQLPAVSIDHLGLSQYGLTTLARLAEKGVHIKATGFGRTDFEILPAVKLLYSANPGCLMFGTDLPCTRAPQPYSHCDFRLIADAMDTTAARDIFSRNAIRFYSPNTAM